MPSTAKKKTARIKAPSAAVVSLTYMLRTCESDMSAYNNFKWPTSGKVECPDWNSRKVCGGGLHGLLHGKGNQNLLSKDPEAKWLVVAVDTSDVVVIDDEKVKVPRGNVVFCGAGSEAIAKLLELDQDAEASTLPFYQASASGYQGQASASGYQGQASASGDYGQASASGYQGQASASGYQGQASASGDYGQA
ncbi:MAG TPA: collagen-like protein, partial [Gemmatimonadaceae bacterium]